MAGRATKSAGAFEAALSGEVLCEIPGEVLNYPAIWRSIAPTGRSARALTVRRIQIRRLFSDFPGWTKRARTPKSIQNHMKSNLIYFQTDHYK